MIELYAPASYWALTEEARHQIVNGCGPAGWKGGFIPDNLYGLSIHKCCDIHDYMYTVGLTYADKQEADRVFLNNMQRVCETSSLFVLKRLRLRAAKGYYETVEHIGGQWFWANKNSKENMGCA